MNSEIRNSLNRVLRWIIWALLPVAVIVANGEMQARGGWERAISTGSWTSARVSVIASVIAMVPLGLVLLTSVASAVAGLRLAREKVLIQELAAVEGLARVDVLCLDKTGTLTERGIVFDAAHQLAQTPEPGWEQALGWFAAEPEANATAQCLAAAFDDDDGNGDTRTWVHAYCLGRCTHPGRDAGCGRAADFAARLRRRRASLQRSG